MKSLVSFFALLCGGFALFGAEDKLSDHILFHLDFESQLKARIAKGNPEGVFNAKCKEKVQLVPGFKGNGFLTGAPYTSIRYALKGNMNGKSGTITFWQKKLDNVEFNKNDKRHHIFFDISGNNSGRNLLFYKYGDCFSPWILDRYKNEKRKISDTISLPKEKNYDKLGWNQYAYVWDGAKSSLYLNGICVGSKDRQQAFGEIKGGSMQFGQSWVGKNDNNRIMDEIIVYDRALTAAELYSVYQQERQTVPAPLVTLAEQKTAIKLDGKMGDGEYTAAAAIPLLFSVKTASVAEVPAVVYLTYDKENLYFFLKSPIGKKAFEKAHTALLNGMFLRERTTHDMDVENDDSFVMDLLKDNVNSFLAVNTIDIRYDYTITDEKHIKLDWNPAWKTVSQINEHGWAVECAVPLKSLGIEPGKTTEIRGNFARNWKKLKMDTDSYAQDFGAHKGAYRKNKKYGTIRFGGNDTVAVNFETVRRFDCNGADFQVILKNTSAKAKKVQIEFKSGYAFLDRKTLTIPAGKTVVYAYNKQFSKPAVDLSFRVSSAEKNGSDYYYFNAPVYSKEDLLLNIASLPTAEKLFINGSFRHLNLNPANGKITVRIVSGGKEYGNAEYKLTSLEFQSEISTAKYPVGEYNVEVSLLENERVIATKTLLYKKSAMPAWYGNQIGFSDKVPYPWTPVKVKNNKVELLNTAYDFGSGVLPEKIFAAGENILSAPIRTELATDKGAGTVKLKNKVVSRKDTEVVIAGENKVNGVDFKMHTTVEYDGYMWHRLTVDPGKTPREIRKLQILIPLKKEYSELIVPYDYTLSTTGNLTTWHGSSRPLWIGSADRGIAYVAEHTHNWSVKDFSRELEAANGKDGGYIRINLITAPLKLTKAETFEFSLQATPAKPVAKNYRSMRFLAYNNLKPVFAKEENADMFIWWYGGWSQVTQSNGDVCYPAPRPRFKPSTTNYTWGKGNKVSCLPYFQLHETWGLSPEFQQFGYEWIDGFNMPVITVKKPNDNRTPVCQNSRSFQDFTLYGLQKFVKQANLRGYYFDMSQPKSCSNTHHGCGYVKDGQVLPTTNYRGARQMVKRIYTMLVENRKDALIMYHNSGQICAQVHGFAGAFLDGENFVSRLQKNRGYQKILRPDVFKAEYMGRNFGVIGAMLPEFRATPAMQKYRKTKDAANTVGKAEYEECGAHQNYLFGLGLLHDSHITTGWMYNAESRFTAFEILRQMNYSHGDLKYIPYWQQKSVSLKPEEAVCSIYIGKNAAYLVIMNLTKQTRDFTFNVKFADFGLTGDALQVRNLCQPEKVTCSGGKITLEKLPSFQYRVIELGK